jgi:hypothetical protein
VCIGDLAVLRSVASPGHQTLRVGNRVPGSSAGDESWEKVRVAVPGLPSLLVGFPRVSSAVAADFTLGYFRAVPPRRGAREIWSGLGYVGRGWEGRFFDGGHGCLGGPRGLGREIKAYGSSCEQAARQDRAVRALVRASAIYHSSFFTEKPLPRAGRRSSPTRQKLVKIFLTQLKIAFDVDSFRRKL